MITRRRVLLGGVLIALGGAGVTFRLPSTSQTLQVLSEQEAELIEAIAAILFPPGHFRVAGGDGGTAPVVDDIVAHMMAPPARIGFRYMLRAVDISARVSRGVRFTRLDPDEQREVIDIWFSERPPVRRMASDSIKIIIGMGFLRRPEVIEDIGWRTGCLGGAV